MKHTPGNWRFYTEPQPNGCPIVGTNGLMICMLAHSVHHPEQKEEALANARLIAAAPELLEALRWYVESDEVNEAEGNEFWLAGKNRAKALIASVVGDIGETE